MKPIDVKSSTYINSSEGINDKYPAFKTNYIVRISKYKNVFVKVYTPNFSEEAFVIKKFKMLCCEHFFINDLDGEEMFGTFY